jgi:preprotein translocase subunit SecD
LAGKKQRRNLNNQQQKQAMPASSQADPTAAGSVKQQPPSMALGRAVSATNAAAPGGARTVGSGAGIGGPGGPQRPQAKKPATNWGDAGILALIVVAIAAIIIFAGQPIVSELQKHFGLDLQGGVRAVFTASPLGSTPVNSDSMSALRNNFVRRLDANGVASPTIQIENGNRILVELAGVKNPEDLITQLGRTATMEFRTEGPDGKTDDGPVVLTGADLKQAKADLDSSTSQPEVTLTFNAEGTKKFATATAANVGKQIGIYLDNQLLTNPKVDMAIPSGNAVISGGYKTLADAQKDAVLLNAGALPLSVSVIQKETVGPTLGQDSLNKSVWAGLIGLGIVFLFMIFYYRVPGIVADLSLIVYALIMVGLYILVHATLTLDGIAAFIISLGMAVDANILIYERLKEELRAGKTLRSSFDAGFRHALRTILDCNVNTLIGAIVLYELGSADVKGFAVTLFIGVFTSLFTAVTFTRLIMNLLVSSRIVLNPKWYGLRTKSAAALAKPAV